MLLRVCVHYVSVDRERLLNGLVGGEIQLWIILVDGVVAHHFLVKLVLVCRAAYAQFFAALASCVWTKLPSFLLPFIHGKMPTYLDLSVAASLLPLRRRPLGRGFLCCWEREQVHKKWLRPARHLRRRLQFLQGLFCSCFVQQLCRRRRLRIFSIS